MAFNEKPPMLTGNQQSDMVRMRDYLFRLANSLDAIASAPAVYAGTNNPALSGSSSSDSSTKSEIEKIRKSAQELRDLIIQNANKINYITEYTSKDGGLWQKISSEYVATGDFGEYQEEMQRTIEQLPGSIVETSAFKEKVQSAVGNFFTEMSGQIRRGFIEDPEDSSKTIFGIAISKSLQFKSEIPRSDGTYNYYELADNQTFGFYTSDGWQFWINGHKSGWFESTNNMLHVRKVVAEDLLQISGKWQIRAIDGGRGLEFVYIGS